LKSLTESLSEIYFRITESSVIPPSSATLISIPKLFPSKIKCEDPDYVYIYPVLQMSAHNIKQDTLFSNFFYSFLPLIQETNSRIILCTSYFNVTKWMKNIILTTKSKWRILTSSPESNSFFNSKGFSCRIPFIYRYNLHSFVEQSKSTGNDVQAFEFISDNQTFHAKGNIFVAPLVNVCLGLFIRLKDGGTLSTIGSSNFGYRSESRDNELQFYIFSKNPTFNMDLKEVMF
jgi:CDP-diacylglycerol---glycerol-3-phosphate 3-phosphatidyltransferase